MIGMGKALRDLSMDDTDLKILSPTSAIRLVKRMDSILSIWKIYLGNIIAAMAVSGYIQICWITAIW